MKTNQIGQRGQGNRTNQQTGKRHEGKGTAHSVRKNEDVSTADRAEEPAPRPTVPPNPDLPPNPSRREYEDPDHEHTHREPSARL